MRFTGILKMWPQKFLFYLISPIIFGLSIRGRGRERGWGRREALIFYEKKHRFVLILRLEGL